MMQSTDLVSPDTLVQLARMESFLARDPANRELLALVIDLRLAAAQPERAQQAVDAALALFPADPFFLARAGNVLIAGGQWEQAAALFESLLAAHADVHLAYNLALARFWLGRHEQAYEALAPYAQSDQTGSEAMALLVRLLHHLGRFAPLKALFQAHFERCKGDADFLAAASLAYLDEGLEQQAGQLSALALATGARPAEALVVAGDLALARGNADLALTHFKEVLLRSPGEGRSWMGAGMASLLKQDVAGATAQLEHALKLMPGDVGTLHGLGWCKIYLKDPDAAEPLLRQALEADPGFPESHGALAVVAAMRGEREVAEAGIARALALDSDSPSAGLARQILAGEGADAMRFDPVSMRLLGKGKAAGRPGSGYAQPGHMPRRK